MFGCILGALFHNRAKFLNYKKEKEKSRHCLQLFQVTRFGSYNLSTFSRNITLIKNTTVGTTPKSANSYLEEQAFQIRVSILQSYIKRNCTMNTGKLMFKKYKDKLIN